MLSIGRHVVLVVVQRPDTAGSSHSRDGFRVKGLEQVRERKEKKTCLPLVDLDHLTILPHGREGGPDIGNCGVPGSRQRSASLGADSLQRTMPSMLIRLNKGRKAQGVVLQGRRALRSIPQNLRLQKVKEAAVRFQPPCWSQHKFQDLFEPVVAGLLQKLQ